MQGEEQKQIRDRNLKAVAEREWLEQQLQSKYKEIEGLKVSRDSASRSPQVLNISEIEKQKGSFVSPYSGSFTEEMHMEDPHGHAREEYQRQKERLDYEQKEQIQRQNKEAQEKKDQLLRQRELLKKEEAAQRERQKKEEAARREKEQQMAIQRQLDQDNKPAKE